MTICEKNSPLFLLQDNATPLFSTGDRSSDVEKIAVFMNEDFAKIRPIFKKKIQLISEQFYTAFSNASKPLGRLRVKETVDVSGTYVMPKPQGRMFTVFYDVSALSDKAGWNIYGTIIYFLMDSIFTEPYLIHFSHTSGDKLLTYTNSSAIKDGIDMNSYVQEILGLVVFSKYFEIEAQILQPVKVIVHLDKIYRNESVFPIEILHPSGPKALKREDF